MSSTVEQARRTWTTDLAVWHPPLMSMITHHGSLNLTDLTRPKGVSWLVGDFGAETLEDLELLGQKSEWPNKLEEDWKHALSPDMIELFNDFYFEADVDGNIGLFCSKCEDPIDQVDAPSVGALSVYLVSVWQHGQSGHQ